MYEAYWGLESNVFGEAGDVANYYPASSHVEALARLHFLVEQRCRLGLLLGDWGTGKSLLLKVAARELRRPQRMIGTLCAQGVDGQEFVQQLAEAWQLNPDRDSSPALLWQMIGDRCLELRYQRRNAVVLIDDIDDAASGLIAQVARLIDVAGNHQTRLTVVMTAHPQRLASIGRRLLELIELRVELQPWEFDDTQGFIRSALSRAGRVADAFAPEAVERLHELAAGNARHVQHLVHLSLAAAAGQRLPLVDEHTVDTVVAELGVPAPSPLPI